jgi:hypothetical protein
VHVVFQSGEGLTESQQGNRSIHLKTWDPPVARGHQLPSEGWQPRDRPNTDALITLPTLETSLRCTADRKTLESLVLAAKRSLVIAMQSVEMT